MVSLRAQIIRAISRWQVKGVSLTRDLANTRARFEKLGAWQKAAPGVAVKTERIAGVDCEWLIPDGCDNAPVILYLHGGAFVVGSPRTHRKMVSYMAKACGMRALLPDYRLAPENVFPAGLDDSIAVYRGLLADGVAGSSVFVGGDSAGGNLALATMLAARDHGDEMPAGGILLSPFLDLACTGESVVTNAGKDPWFDPAAGPVIASLYCAESELRDPLVSPLYADVANLPPVLIQVGDTELLLSDATRLADNIAAAGGDVVLQTWPEMWHVFQFFVGLMPESRRAIEDIAAYTTSIQSHSTRTS